MSNAYTDLLSARLSPTVLTARAPLMGGASRGDWESKKLLDTMKDEGSFEETVEVADESSREELYRFSSGYGKVVWARSNIIEKVFRAMRMTTFVDLGCGLSARGLRLSNDKSVRYYGVDLPAVTDRMNSAVKKLISGDILKDSTS